MGKSRARNTQRHNDTVVRGKSTVKRRQRICQNGSLKKVVLPPTKATNKSKTTTTTSTSQPKKRDGKVPFLPLDNVLLVGEGDFSFTLSLVKQYKPASVVATCFDSEKDLLDKYPGVKATFAQIEQFSPSLSGNINDNDNDNNNNNQNDDHDDHDGDNDHDGSFEGFSPTTTSATDAASSAIVKVDDDNNDGNDMSLDSNSDCGSDHQTLCRIMYGIDATKLSTAHKKALRHPFGYPFTKIIFNFPHVGGLSTDVNRQVRSNQQLLVGFFNSAKSLLLTRTNHGKPVQRKYYGSFEEEEKYDDDGNVKPRQEDIIIPEKGQIIVTLFEGEPYTLWNIRDLARHCGLQVVESFKFPWSAYSGYKHARTAGDIVTGRDRTNEGKRKGAWRGEEREARSYIIEIKDDSNQPRQQHRQQRGPAALSRNKNNRRGGGDDSSDEDD